MAGIINKLPAVCSPNLIVDMQSMDDAGVFRVNDELALVQTVDFFYPIVNDPRAFGRIVAANSLSDIWAMGARPLTAMNILAYPAGKVPVEAISDLLQGGSEKLEEAGTVLVGGHTMEQDDFLYGMSVSGIIHPQEAITNSKAKPGDLLILTKPIGTGVYCNAYKAGALAGSHYRVFVQGMERLNLYAAEILRRTGVSAMTDVTGFGLLGHALPMARNAGVTLRFEADKVPVLPEIERYMREFNPLGVCKTRQYVDDFTLFAPQVSAHMVKLVQEAQTSGGLLAAVDAKCAEETISRLREAGDCRAEIVGEVLPLAREDGKYVYLQVD